ncbi:MAG: DUF2279 domain-containing protein, partial [Saprospiraceae bacterium]|nr:DUF2279 domain-containing protein [Saprospiraceae bacterium]
AWLNIALGYSVENVFGAYSNYQPARNLTRYRQYFLSFDIDLSKIKIKKIALFARFAALLIL